jgi:hypothetical protein
MRDYRSRAGITLRSRRRISRGRGVGFAVLFVVVAAAALLWWQQSRPPTNDTASSETPREPAAKGAIPLQIPGQTPKSTSADSD